MRIAILTTIFLFSCSNTGIYGELATALKQILSKPEDISIEKVNSIPYDVMQARIGKTQNSLIVLETINGDELKWTSSNFVKIYTRNGIIVKLTGLENELNLIEVDRDHPFLNQLKIDFDLTKEIDLVHFYNFKNPDLFNLPVKTKLKYIGKENIEILEKEFVTLKFKETSQQNLINWDFENTYWYEPRLGKVLKSIQKATPIEPEIHLKLLIK